MVALGYCYAKRELEWVAGGRRSDQGGAVGKRAEECGNVGEEAMGARRVSNEMHVVQ